MEDSHFISEDVLKSDGNKSDLKVSIFCVLDGHGGKEVVTCITNELPSFIIDYVNILSETPTDKQIEEKFEDIFTKFNEKLKN